MVLDKQAWSAAGSDAAPQITWGDVFSNKTIDGDTGFSTAGVHSELNIDNMGRFIVLKSWMIELDATDPQRPLASISQVRPLGRFAIKVLISSLDVIRVSVSFGVVLVWVLLPPLSQQHNLWWC